MHGAAKPRHAPASGFYAIFVIGTISDSIMHNHFDEGQKLFNTQHYWQAHEAWEYCWRAAQPPMDNFYQGLIQAAAALVHLQRGNPRGLQLNWNKARPRLLAATEILDMSELAEFINQMDRIVYDNGQYDHLPTLHLVIKR